MIELYRKYRPKTFDEVFGQDRAVSMLRSMIDSHKVPHAMMFTGPSGCGKTTLARILRRQLKCAMVDFSEQNCADIRGIDNVREIRRRMALHPFAGKTKIWLLDEVHKISNDAQNALLKMLEDTPSHVYFILCTTDHQRLIKTIRTRCTEIPLSPFGEKDLLRLISYIAAKEDRKVGKSVAEKIAEHSDGSARKALVLLGSILDLEDEKAQLESIAKATAETQAIQLCRLLLNPRTSWKEIGPMLKELEKEDPEQLRWMVLGYMKAVLNNSGQERAFDILCAFERNFYDSKHAGLSIACYQVTHER